MKNKKIAKKLNKIAKELLSVDFPNQKAMNDYLKQHPLADRKNHKVVEFKPETRHNSKDIMTNEVTEYQKLCGELFDEMVDDGSVIDEVLDNLDEYFKSDSDYITIMDCVQAAIDQDWSCSPYDSNILDEHDFECELDMEKLYEFFNDNVGFYDEKFEDEVDFSDNKKNMIAKHISNEFQQYLEDYDIETKDIYKNKDNKYVMKILWDEYAEWIKDSFGPINDF